MAARRPASPPSAAEPGPLPPVRVGRIGGEGDGVAVLPDGTALYLPGTLPGELVQPGPASRHGKGLLADTVVLEPSADRVTPPCPHFGPCGGCTLQHWRDEPYAGWKAGAAAASLGWDAPVPIARTPPGARRRMDLAVQRGSSAVRIGLHRRRSRDVVDMHACPVLHPALFALVQALRPVLLRLGALRREASVSVNLLDSGPDLLLRTDGVLSAADRVLLAGVAERHGVARISWAPQQGGLWETACQLRPAVTAFGGVATPLPPGAFLQASVQGEHAIVAAVLAALPHASTARPVIVELYAGCGTLTHALSARGRVLAFEGDADAAGALRLARNPRVTVTQRNLVRQPLQPAELARAAVIVLDPPFAGAAAQMPALAAARRPVVYVSCNPAALARDARVLLGAGFKVTSLACIDQFLWSAGVESVVGFMPG